MKKKYDNCRKIKRSTLLVLGCLAMGGAMLLQTGDSTVNAMTKEEAEQQKEEAKENEKSAKDILNAMEEQQNELVQEVADLDAQATAVQTEITKKQDEADEIEAGIKDTKKHLKEAQEAQDKQYEAMKQRIQYLYEEGDEEIVDAFITSVSFTDRPAEGWRQGRAGAQAEAGGKGCYGDRPLRAAVPVQHSQGLRL